MLSKTLAKAFESPLLAFNQSTGAFSFIRDRQTTISVEGAGMVRRMTERALHRSGYRTDQEAKLKVVINDTEEGLEWILINDLETELCRSLYELINHLPEEGLT
jgi:hypothetical protein